MKSFPPLLQTLGVVLLTSYVASQSIEISTRLANRGGIGSIQLRRGFPLYQFEQSPRQNFQGRSARNQRPFNWRRQRLPTLSQQRTGLLNMFRQQYHTIFTSFRRRIPSQIRRIQRRVSLVQSPRSWTVRHQNSIRISRTSRLLGSEIRSRSWQIRRPPLRQFLQRTQNVLFVPRTQNIMFQQLPRLSEFRNTGHGHRRQQRQSFSSRNSNTSSQNSDEDSNGRSHISINHNNNGNIHIRNGNHGPVRIDKIDSNPGPGTDFKITNTSGDHVTVQESGLSTGLTGGGLNTDPRMVNPTITGQAVGENPYIPHSSARESTIDSNHGTRSDLTITNTPGYMAAVQESGLSTGLTGGGLNTDQGVVNPENAGQTVGENPYIPHSTAPKSKIISNRGPSTDLTLTNTPGYMAAIQESGLSTGLTGSRLNTDRGVVKFSKTDQTVGENPYIAQSTAPVYRFINPFYTNDFGAMLRLAGLDLDLPDGPDTQNNIDISFIPSSSSIDTDFMATTDAEGVSDAGSVEVKTGNSATEDGGASINVDVAVGTQENTNTVIPSGQVAMISEQTTAKPRDAKQVNVDINTNIHSSPTNDIIVDKNFVAPGFKMTNTVTESKTSPIQDTQSVKQVVKTKLATDNVANSLTVDTAVGKKYAIALDTNIQTPFVRSATVPASLAIPKDGVSVVDKLPVMSGEIAISPMAETVIAGNPKSKDTIIAAPMKETAIEPMSETLIAVKPKSMYTIRATPMKETVIEPMAETVFAETPKSTDTSIVASMKETVIAPIAQTVVAGESKSMDTIIAASMKETAIAQIAQTVIAGEPKSVGTNIAAPMKETVIAQIAQTVIAGEPKSVGTNIAAPMKETVIEPIAQTVIAGEPKSVDTIIASQM